MVYMLQRLHSPAAQPFRFCFYDCLYQYLCEFISLKEGEDQKEITIEPAQALDEVEPLPEDCYTRPISLPEGKFVFYRTTLIVFVFLITELI